ncbi:hypothetical protein phiGM223_02 [Pseudomonas phage phiGM22-3]|uniref:Uncharacterized protein n=1 Tax=Pseudomonas phage phiGM22-3 TaxID=2816462 RepID=A0A8T8IVZ3_9CAUD|nr:hypothetical protein phiGM223_02 [Pseudomonas phage phiGM22-3]
MTRQAIHWAMQHDWYSHANGDVVYVVDSLTNEVIPFNDLEALRAWAGY